MSTDPSDTPIDAEFEPAERPDPTPKRTGPGWAGVGAACVAAALAGGAIGVVSSGDGGKYASASEVSVDIAGLQDRDSDLTGRLDLLRDDLAEVRARLASQGDARDERLAETEAALAALETRIAALDETLAAVIGETSAPAVPEPVEADPDTVSDPDIPADDETPVETSPTEPEALPSLPVLLARIEALEAAPGVTPVDADGNPVAPPIEVGELTNTVVNLRRRIRRLEQTNTATLQTLEARAETLAALDERLAGVEDAVGGGSAASIPADLLEDLRGLRSDVETLRERVDTAPPVIAPGATLSVDGDGSGTGDARYAAAALALSAIEAATRRGDGFAPAHGRLADALPGDPDVEALERFAREGAPTVTQLRQSFDEVEEAALRADVGGQSDDGLGWLRRAFSGVVVVRRSDGSEVGSTADTVAVARRHLSRSDLRAAVETLETLEGPSRLAVADWLTNAKRRLDLEARLDDIRLRMIGVGPE